MAMENTETLPPHIPVVFSPPLTEFVAEDRLSTSSGGVGETKVPGEGRGSVLSVAKIDTRPESSRPSSHWYSSRLDRLLCCHPLPTRRRIGCRGLGADRTSGALAPATFSVLYAHLT